MRRGPYGWRAGSRSPSGTGTTTCAESTPWSSPAASRTGTTCAAAPSPGSPRSWPRSCGWPVPGRRRAGAARARHLQRLPGAVRVAPAARGAGAQRPPQVRLPRPAAADRATSTVWTNRYETGDEVVVPLKNGEGGYVADVATLDRLEGEGRVVARYLGGNPNGSYREIAGVSNASGTVVGLMPHPEHAVEPGSARPRRRRPLRQHRRARVLHLGAHRRPLGLSPARRGG